MNLHEAETRLAQEESWLDSLIHGTGNSTSIALAQAHVNHWRSEVFRLRLIDEGGWHL